MLKRAEQARADGAIFASSGEEPEEDQASRFLFGPDERAKPEYTRLRDQDDNVSAA